MSTQAVAQAIQQLLAALNMGGDEFSDHNADALGGLAMDDDNHIQSWNDRKVPYKGQVDKPPFVDKNFFAPEMNAVEATMGQPDDEMGETNAFLQTGGGV